MMSFAKIQNSNIDKIVDYFEGQRQREQEGRSQGYQDRADYYLSAESAGEPAGRWIGSGAADFGLSGEVNAEDLRAMLLGKDPKTEKPLVQIQGGKHVSGFDCTYSAPKSVSAIAAIGDPELRGAVEEAHRAAVASAVGYLESQATSRKGHGGTEHEAVKLAVAAYDHSTSRAEDPQTHTHALVINIAKRLDGSYGTLDGSLFYRHQKAAGVLYQAELASRMRDLGFELEVGGTVGTFEVAGVPDEAVKHWSSRREAIERELEAQGLTGASGKAAQTAALATRQAKQYSPLAELRERWVQEAKEHGFSLETIRGMINHSRENKPWSLQGEARDKIIQDLTSRNSTFGRQEAIWTVGAACMKEAPGAMDRIRLEVEVDRLLTSKDIVLVRHDERGQPIMTTRKHLEIEKQMVRDFADLAKRKVEGGVSSQEVEFRITIANEEMKDKGGELAPEQEQAIRTMLGNSRIATLYGMAGTGKSTCLEAVRRAYEASGYTVIGLATQGKTAKDLQDGSGIKSQTIASFLQQYGSGKGERAEGLYRQAEEARKSGDKPKAAALAGDARASLRRFASLTENIREQRRAALKAKLQGVGRELLKRTLPKGFVGRDGDYDTAAKYFDAAKRARQAGQDETAAALGAEGVRHLSTTKRAVLADRNADQLSQRLKAAQREIGPRTVILVEEAGMVDDKYNAEIARIAVERGAIVRNVGDHKQFPGIGPSGGFAALRKITKAAGADAELTDIRRQTDAWAKQAVRDFSEGKAAEALEAYDKRGLLTVAPGKELPGKIIEDWHKDGANGMMLTAVNIQAHQLNQAARAKLQEDGKLPGDQATVQTMLGQSGVAVGDKIMLRENVKADSKKAKEGGMEIRGGEKIVNGDTGTITRIGHTRDGSLSLTAKLKDGREVSWRAEDYTDWHHAYASTNYKSQGQTVDRTYFLYSHMDNANAAYVANSRFREENRIYMSTDVQMAMLTREDRAKNVDLLAVEVREATIKDAAYAMSRDGSKKLALDQMDETKRMKEMARQEPEGFLGRFKEWAAGGQPKERSHELGRDR